MISTVRQAANNRRTLASIKSKLLLISTDWGEVDEFFRAQFETLASDVEQLEKHLDEFVKAGGQV
ncbi:hypothetical protein EDC30_109130 [Paucimonas lemoignei]|uniref:Uncharacterized protein n=1 Tax=Paucimonas lemoignei TaxID=29443 RepID=A0A4R3HUI1_PAULE|nr:hypothetical protein [Paucimonas lemoignei]TCS35831.1 hypothetical protein EDC30_109130 [Paucimonas lemoignei]